MLYRSAAAVSQRERAERVEMQEVCAFEVAGAIEQAGRGHVPDVDGPQAEGEDQAVGAEAARWSGGEVVSDVMGLPVVRP